MEKGNVMKINVKSKIGMAAVALLVVASAASAQSGSEVSATAGTLVQTMTQTIQGSGGAGGAVAFGGSMTALAAKPVTGAPYSAQIVTETVQPFADGNSITHTSTSTVYRDSQGRTRREQNINVVGPSQVSGSPIQFITIDDPVTGVHYTLNPNKLIATEITKSERMGASAGMLPLKVIPSDGSNISVTYFSSSDGAAAGGGGGTISVKSGTVSDDNVTTESLGAETIQGLSCLGTRITRTIPAGQIGNAQPILITTDKWYSQDLQIEVKTVHSDPRTGTTTTALVNLSRNEPNPTLFSVPPGYTVNNPGNAKYTFKQQEPL
jgi:hypothetical protein